MPPKTHLFSLTLVATFLLCSWSGLAFSQTVAINESSIQRTTSFRGTAQEPLWISKKDCLANDAFFFPVTVSNYTNYQLEVWVGSGTDCRPPEARRPTTGTCWQVWKGVPTSTGLTVEIAVRDIVSRRKPSEGRPTGPGTGTVDDCQWNEATTAPLAADLYFMFIDTGSEEQVGGTLWQTKFDLAGPTAPQKVSAGIGDSLLVVKWSESTDTDKTGYRFYCDPIRGKEDEQSNVKPFAGDASIDVEPQDGELQDAEPQDAEPQDGEAQDGEAQEAGAGGSSGESGGEPSSSCPTTVLIEGKEPDEALYCGSGSSTGTTGKVTGLINGVQYSVAVAAVDRVGNVGKLSNVTCATPAPVDDFFQLYREAGGKAGGGFCSASNGIGTGSGLFGLALVATGAFVGSLRRRRGS